MRIQSPSLFILALVSSVLVSSPVLSSPSTNKFDDEIKSAVRLWWPDYPFWDAWKAQLYQESLLNPDAISHVGARGLAQFMPGTWDQVVGELKWDKSVSPHSSKRAIQAGAYYMAKLRKSWSAPRPQEDRQKLAQASYNAGFGNILKAQRNCGGANLYDEIIICLPMVTGRHSKETITYVERIIRWRAKIVSGGL